MEQCPRCNAYMDFHMTYSCGNPFPYYSCPCCGYDERDVKNTATATIGKFTPIGEIPTVTSPFTIKKPITSHLKYVPKE